MDKNTITGLIVIVAIIIGFSLFNRPSQEEIDAQKHYEDSVALVQADTLGAAANANNAAEIAAAIKDSVDKLAADVAAVQEAMRLDSIRIANPAEADAIVKANNTRAAIEAEIIAKQKSEKFGPFAHALTPKAEYYTIENEKFILKLSTQGGQIVEVKLKEDFRTYDSLPVFLWEEEYAKYGLKLNFAGTELNTADFVWDTESENLELTGDQTQDFKMRLNGENADEYVEFIYTVTGDKYDLGFDINVVGLPELLDTREPTIDFSWFARPTTKEKSIETERRYCTIMWKPFDGKRDYLWEGSDNEEVLEEKANWVAFKQDFFSAILTNDLGFLPESKLTTITNDTDTFLLDYYADLKIPAGNSADARANMSFFFGPNEYKTLKTYDKGYEHIIDLGWGIFGYVNQWVVIPIFNFLEWLGLGYGLIIFLLTIIIKIILLPLMYRNYKSSAKMRVLKPEIEELAKKYPDKKDAVKKQQGQMALYKQTGVNPMAGCIPMVIQMPILYAMFRFFPSSIELRQESFLWADDLSGYDSILDLGFSIPMYGDHVSLFTLLMAASTFFYTRMNSSQMQMPNQPGMPNMKIIMNFFPIMMLFFFNNFSAALSYYYFIANVTSIGQMLLIKKYFISEDKIRSQIEDNKKKPKKASKWQQRISEMQKQQQDKKKK